MAENEMVGWHHRLDGHEFDQALRVGDRQESLAGCSPQGRKESNMTSRLCNKLPNEICLCCSRDYPKSMEMGPRHETGAQ